MSKRRVVITGMGVISPLGLSVAETWSKIVQGQSGIRFIDHFDTDNFPIKICGKVQDFNPENYFPLKEIKKVDAFTQYAIAASQEAMQDAKLIITEENADRIGVSIGSGIGGITTIEDCHSKFLEAGYKRVSPFFIPAAIANMAAGNVSIRFGLKGPNLSIITACTTGTHNIGNSARLIAYGDADVMLAGGAEMGTSSFCIAGFNSARALSQRFDDPTRASRPWDKDRDGFVLSEGAAVLVLEEYEHAIKRGATIYAELVGYGMSADAFHITSPDDSGRGFVSTMMNAVKDAGIKPEDIDYINAHGTSTQAGDIIEASSVKQAFGDHAYRLAISSTKSMTGHLLGAAGSIEAIFSIMALQDQLAPPTINLDNPSEGCDLNFVPYEAQQRKIRYALSNSFGFGGTNGSLIFKQWSE